MKSIAEWLQSLPLPYRDLALRNHSNYNTLGKADCLANALVLAFKWTSTREGGVFWRTVHSKCVNDRYDPEYVNPAPIRPRVNVFYENPKPIVVKEKVEKHKPVKIKAPKTVWLPKQEVVFDPNDKKKIEKVKDLLEVTVIKPKLIEYYKPFSDRKKQINNE